MLYLFDVNGHVLDITTRHINIGIMRMEGKMPVCTKQCKDHSIHAIVRSECSSDAQSSSICSLL